MPPLLIAIILGSIVATGALTALILWMDRTGPGDAGGDAP